MSDIIGSNFPAEPIDELMPAWSKINGVETQRLIGASHVNGYGQNQFGGPSSDTPGKNTTSGFLPGPGTPVNSQLRKVDAAPLPITTGMKKPSA